MNRLKVSGTTSLIAFALIGSASLVGTSALVYERLQGNDVNKDMKLSLDQFSLLKIDMSKVPVLQDPANTARGRSSDVKTGREDDMKKMK